MNETKLPENKNRKISLEKVLPRLDSTSDAPVKLIIVILYLAGAYFIHMKQGDLSTAVTNVPYASPVMVALLQNMLSLYLIGGGIVLIILILTPIGKRMIQTQLQSIGLVNHMGEIPELKRKYKDKQNPRICIWEFTSQGIPLKVWKDKQAAIETALDITIVKMINGSGKSRVLLYTVHAVSDLPDLIKWSDQHLSQSHIFKTEKRRGLTKPEQELLRNFLKNHPIYNHWYPIFAVMVGTGLRVSGIPKSLDP